MAGEIRRLKFLEGVIVTTPISSEVVSGFSGQISLSTGEYQKSVSFSSNMPDATYKVTLSFECEDSDPVFPSALVKNKSVSGFDILLNGPVFTNNLKISYMVTT